METVDITKLVHGGQGLGELADGRKVFVWNALPGETVSIRIIRNKSSYAEAIAEKIIKPSVDRLEPKEDNFLATSPWQILSFEAENHWKKEITKELFSQAGMKLPDFNVVSDDKQYEYRNKMEYSFWGDEEGLHLALYKRGSHGKEIVSGSRLALPALDNAANNVLKLLNNRGTRAGNLKTIIVRSNQAGETVAALFVKTNEFPKIELPNNIKGLKVYHSNPKSPASIPTKLLYQTGDPLIEDELLGKPFVYDVMSFFQVNPPVFELVLKKMREYVHEPSLIDMYAGVGSIGLSLATKSVTLVELDSATAKMASLNAVKSNKKATVIEASSEKALDYIEGKKTIIFDPPRAGLHDKVVDRLLETLPAKVVYLSCNPVTQARDLAKLKNKYKLVHFEVFNFFPRTPHIESLSILEVMK